MKARVIGNPYNLGNGYYPVGQIVEIERETAHYYVLVNSCYRISKKTLALTGWAGRYAHSIEFEIIADAPDATAPALVAALNKMADALPKCALSLAVPLEWNGRTVDRARLAAWCGRQGGNDFALALAVVPGARLALHWVTGPRPVAGLEAGILADARTWLDELGALEDEDAAEPVDLDDVPAEPASVTPCDPCEGRIFVPRNWNGYTVDRSMLQAWTLDILGPLFPAVEFHVVASDRLGSDGVLVKLRSRAEPSALVFPGSGRARDGIIAYMLNRLDEVYPGV